MVSFLFENKVSKSIGHGSTRTFYSGQGDIPSWHREREEKAIIIQGVCLFIESTRRRNIDPSLH